MRAHNTSRLVGLALALVVVLSALAGPAAAAPTPPAADSRFVGTWINTNTDTRGIKQIVIRSADRVGLRVDAFGACGGGLCEWGMVPAKIYGSNVSASRGTHFQTHQRFLADNSEFARTALFGRLISTHDGLRLSVRRLTVFTDGSGRRNYTGTETFALGKGQAPSINGNPVTSYLRGLPPAPLPRLAGTWKSTSSTPALAKINIAISSGTPVVHGFGACSPSPCDLGKVRGVTYGSSISSAQGATVLASYSFGFKKEQLVIRYTRGFDGVERLVVANYNEFTDGSGRSNYTVTETFVRA